MSTPSLVPVVHHVDVGRFAGSWFLLAALDKKLPVKAHRPVVTFIPESGGVLRSSVVFRDGGANGPPRVIEAAARVKEGSRNAEWREGRWPFAQQRLVSHLELDYSAAIIACDHRDHAWVIARNASLPERQLTTYMGKLADMGYDPARLVRFDQEPEVERERGTRDTPGGASGVDPVSTPRYRSDTVSC